MEIKGKIIIWQKAKNDKIIYTTSVGRKTEEGKWKNASMIVQLPKDKVVSNGTMINVLSGFLTWYPNENGYPQYKVVITDFDTKGDVALEADAPAPDDSDLPF